MSFEVQPVKRLGRVFLGKMIQPEAKHASDRAVPYLRAAHVQPGGRIIDVDDKTMWFAEGELETHDLRADDVVVVEGGAGFGRSAVLRQDRVGWGFQNSIVRIRPNPTRSCGRFIDYALQAALVSGQIDVACFTATIPHFTADKVGAFPLPAPSVDVQRAIADYLDRETAQIDELIAEQQRLIELLTERRDSIAASALGGRVGTGLRLKWALVESDERAGERAATLPLMSVSITWGVRRRDEAVDGDTRADDLSNYKVCSRGDLVVNRMRAFQGALGLAPEAGLVSPDYAVLKVRPHVDPGWLVAAMKTPPFVAEMARRVKGIGSADLGNARTPRINVADLGEIRVDVPEAAQQATERVEVQSQSEKIDRLVVEAERLIELAQERRAALITAAVTGQLDVRATA